MTEKETYEWGQVVVVDNDANPNNPMIPDAERPASPYLNEAGEQMHYVYFLPDGENKDNTPLAYYVTKVEDEGSGFTAIGIANRYDVTVSCSGGRFAKLFTKKEADDFLELLKEEEIYKVTFYETYKGDMLYILPICPIRYTAFSKPLIEKILLRDT